MTRPSPQKSTCCAWPLQSQQRITKEKPHLRILFAVPWLSADVCVWLLLLSSLQEKNQMFPVRPGWCGERSLPRMPWRMAWTFNPRHIGVARKTSPRNEEAWNGTSVWWSALWNLAALPELFYYLLSVATDLSLVKQLKQLDYRIVKKMLFIDTHKHTTHAARWFNLLYLVHVAWLAICLPCSSTRSVTPRIICCGCSRHFSVCVCVWAT